MYDPKKWFMAIFSGYLFTLNADKCPYEKTEYCTFSYLWRLRQS